MYYRLVLFCFISAQAFAQVNLNDGLVGCYPFSGNANDLSGRNNHGKVSGARLTTDRFGNANSAYDFNGVSDYIEISPDDLQINTFSYSLWIYPRTLPARDQAFFMFSIGSAAGDQAILLGNDYTGVLTGFSNGSYIGYDYNVRCMTGVMPKLNTWYHMVLAKDEANYYFYIDGKLICASPTNGSPAFYGIGTVKATIGERNHYGQAINALIDDIHLYNRSVSQAEVLALYRDLPTSSPEKISLASDKTEPCGGDEITITATSMPELAANYEWSIDGILQTTTYESQLTFSPSKQDSNYVVNISVKASYKSCFQIEPTIQTMAIAIKNCDTLIVPEPPEPETTARKILLVPSAFTPNNDGKNDNWQLFNLSEYRDAEVWIFSRWGEVVFQSKNYLIPWDGTYKNALVSPGPYPYKIYSAGKLIKEGNVTVIR